MKCARLTHRPRQLLHNRSQTAEFEHGHQVGGNGFGRQHGCQHGDACSNECRRAILEQARSHTDHQLGFRIRLIIHLPASD